MKSIFILYLILILNSKSSADICHFYLVENLIDIGLPPYFIIEAFKKVTEQKLTMEDTVCVRSRDEGKNIEIQALGKVIVVPAPRGIYPWNKFDVDE